MKLHDTLIDYLIRLYTTHGGYKEELKLKERLKSVDISVYQQTTGKEILVLTDDLKKKQN